LLKLARIVPGFPDRRARCLDDAGDVPVEFGGMETSFGWFRRSSGDEALRPVSAAFPELRVLKPGLDHVERRPLERAVLHPSGLCRSPDPPRVSRGSGVAS